MNVANNAALPPVDLNLEMEYGLPSPIITARRQSVLRIGAGTKEYALKHVQLPLEKLLHLLSIMEFMRARGFTSFPSIVPNLKGEYFLPRESGIYYLLHWIPGRESNFQNHSDLILYAVVLGRLHRLTKGFYPAGRDWQERWSTGLQKLAALDCSHTSRLAGLREVVPEIIRAGTKSLSLLQETEVSRSLRQPAVVCHHDLSSRNFLISTGNRGFLIDFECARPDVPMLDLAQLLERVMLWHNWDLTLALQLLAAYSEENPLTRGDLGVLLAFLYFPRPLWGLGRSPVIKDSNPQAVRERVKRAEKTLTSHQAIDRLSALLGYNVYNSGDNSLAPDSFIR